MRRHILWVAVFVVVWLVVGELLLRAAGLDRLLATLIAIAVAAAVAGGLEQRYVRRSARRTAPGEMGGDRTEGSPARPRDVRPWSA